MGWEMDPTYKIEGYKRPAVEAQNIQEGTLDKLVKQTCVVQLPGQWGMVETVMAVRRVWGREVIVLVPDDKDRWWKSGALHDALEGLWVRRARGGTYNLAQWVTRRLVSAFLFLQAEQYLDKELKDVCDVHRVIIHTTGAMSIKTLEGFFTDKILALPLFGLTYVAPTCEVVIIRAAATDKLVPYEHLADLLSLISVTPLCNGDMTLQKLDSDRVKDDSCARQAYGIIADMWGANSIPDVDVRGMLLKVLAMAQRELIVRGGEVATSIVMWGSKPEVSKLLRGPYLSDVVLTLLQYAEHLQGTALLISDRSSPHASLDVKPPDRPASKRYPTVLVPLEKITRFTSATLIQDMQNLEPGGRLVICTRKPCPTEIVAAIRETERTQRVWSAQWTLD